MLPPFIHKYNTAIFYNLNVYLGGPDSSVGIVMGYGPDGQGAIPNRSKIFLLSIAFRLALGPTQPPIQWTLGAISPWVNWPGREADYSLPSSTEVKNGGAIPPLPHMSSWHRNSFTFYRTFTYA
jgi:hypothetical protein